MSKIERTKTKDGRVYYLIGLVPFQQLGDLSRDRSRLYLVSYYKDGKLIMKVGKTNRVPKIRLKEVARYHEVDVYIHYISSACNTGCILELEEHIKQWWDKKNYNTIPNDRAEVPNGSYRYVLETIAEISDVLD